MSEQPGRQRLGIFRSPLITPPLREPHELTIIFLHGRGSSSDKFAQPLLEAPVAGLASFQEAFPHARFVFPTAPRRRATLYQRSVINQWFDGGSTVEDATVGYMLDTINFLHQLLKEEISLVGSESRKVFLGGISQGCATALTTLLLWDGPPLGAVVGMCGFLPMPSQLLDIMSIQDQENDTANTSSHEDDVFDRDSSEHKTPSQQVLDLLRSEIGLSASSSDGDSSSSSFLSTPVFLGHGTKDEKVLLQHGNDAAQILQKMGLDVRFREYEGLEHWYSAEMLADIVSFLNEHFPEGASV